MEADGFLWKPPSSLGVNFFQYLQLQLWEAEKSYSKCWTHEGSNRGILPVEVRAGKFCCPFQAFISFFEEDTTLG